MPMGNDRFDGYRKAGRGGTEASEGFHMFASNQKALQLLSFAKWELYSLKKFDIIDRQLNIAISDILINIQVN